MTTTFPKEVIDMKPEISALKKKGQITIPAAIRAMLDLAENDLLQISVEDGSIILKPIVAVPKDQAWFWNEEWQNGEMEADQDIKEGNFKSFNDIDDALKFLNED